jgi:hypothetical protein
MKMNKKILAILTILIALVTIISAKITNPTTNQTTNSSTFPSLETAKTTLKDPTPKIDERLEKEVEISQPWRKIVGIILGFKEKEKITWGVMVGIISFLIAIFVILSWVFELMPFFDNGFVKILSALAMTILTGTTGGIKEMVKFFIGFANSVKLLSEWSTGAIIFFAIIVLVLIKIVKKITKALKKMMEDEKSKVDGTKIGTNLGILIKLKDKLFKKET